MHGYVEAQSQKRRHGLRNVLGRGLAAALLVLPGWAAQADWPGWSAPPTLSLQARIVAVGIPGIAGLRQIGSFHSGGPIPGNAEFLMQTRPGRMLDPRRLLVASASNFGLARSDAAEAEGSLLSLDPEQPHVLQVPPNFARQGRHAVASEGAIRMYAAQSPAYRNEHFNARASTARWTSVAGPRYISINNAFGRPWVANSPYGLAGPGSVTVLDPDGRPLDNAPSEAAGGVFAGALTSRRQVPVNEYRSSLTGLLEYRPSRQLTSGALNRGALGTAFLGPSPDGSGFAVFAVATADGAIAQVHVQDGVDGLLPAGAIQRTEQGGDAALIGMAFKWVPDRVLYVADAERDTIVALVLGDDRQHFKVLRQERLQSAWLRYPVDLAAALPEVSNPRFSSHTTLSAGSDFYVANRGDGSVVRLDQRGRGLARADIMLPGGGSVGAGRLRALAVSADAQRLWLALEGEVPQYPGQAGVIVEVSAFDAGGAFSTQRSEQELVRSSQGAVAGAALFRKEFSAAEGLGPLYNAVSCMTCHHEPDVGGASSREEDFVVRFARMHPVTGRAELVDGRTSQVAKTRRLSGATAHTGIAQSANVASLRMPLSLHVSGLLERIPDAEILAHARPKGDGIYGRVNQAVGPDGQKRIGRYGWKAQAALLEEAVANAFAEELGITSPMVQELSDRGTQVRATDDDGHMVCTVAAYLRQLAEDSNDALKLPRKAGHTVMRPCPASTRRP